MVVPDQAVRIVIATKPADFRKGRDGLPVMAHAELGFAPHAGGGGKRGGRIEVLFWGGSGIVMIDGVSAPSPVVSAATLAAFSP
ncbi:hypothetical protein SAMN05878503_11567 [Cereibacter ovatus]|uniref:Transposase n=1 Tax=Cereibacter ovatus TaxID=439529 RepID=A0A285D276_9RHOB|nr:hypothetical protein [Cereibacter ovatus]SNX73418.1 hypothetical protein SAMN05878503_11567 [Cereibacter ovatus]